MPENLIRIQPNQVGKFGLKTSSTDRATEELESVFGREKSRNSASSLKGSLMESRSISPASSLRNPVVDRGSVPPTFEEFVLKLASSLSVDISSNDNDRDTVMEPAPLVSKERDTFIQNDSRDTIIQNDSVLESSARMSPVSFNDDSLDRSSSSSGDESLLRIKTSPSSKSGKHTNNQTPTPTSLRNVSTSSSSSSSFAPLIIPSRKDSRYWTKEEAAVSPSPNSALSREINYKPPPALQVMNNASCSTPTGTPTFSPSSDTPNLPFSDITSTTTAPKRHLKLVLHYAAESPSKIKVLDTISYKSLLDKISLVTGSSGSIKVIYKDGDGEFIQIVDSDSWEICLESLADEKLTLYITPYSK